MTGLTSVASVRVPRELALEAHDYLRRVGQHGAEGFALWAGELRNGVFLVTRTRIPEQRHLRTESGVLVLVEAEELFRTNMWLYREGLTLIAQLHSHPTDAYHSETDDAMPIVAAVGGLSLVVPYFARHPFSLADYAVYRLTPGEGWVELADEEVAALIVIED
ncbi:hypothetical protein GBA63_19810 [Rubrobacter tropicus]|uniref:JAB domain-containing protein n=1 Tax=Rubrobacter tropicus TaxID=2653851 RepID=A0A6G8QDS9_9ACTN|nr:Mov34/MPN/PAD-1 family protein [Rubrobacter tropicus]QIN84646.1 hypothetical protein GBA63_19810 [Rubrobacter tropicus]